MPPNRLSRIIALTTLTVSLLWILFATFAVPPVILQAYHGESLDIFNDIIIGQATHGIAYYYDFWDWITVRVLLAIIGIGGITLIYTRPEFKAYIRSKTERYISVTSTAPVKRPRLLIIHIVIVLVLFGTLYDLYTDTEHWPFSPYHMYSIVQGSTFAWARVYGITEEGEISLEENSGRYFQPFDTSRLSWALFNLNSRADDGYQLQKGLRHILNRYEQRRAAGEHSGPDLLGFRVYEIEWDLDPMADNKNKPPDRKRLLLEVRVE